MDSIAQRRLEESSSRQSKSNNQKEQGEEKANVGADGAYKVDGG